jgi:hypothetical protein
MWTLCHLVVKISKKETKILTVLSFSCHIYAKVALNSIFKSCDENNSQVALLLYVQKWKQSDASLEN